MFTTNKHYKSATNERVRVKSRHFCALRIQTAGKKNWLQRNPRTHEGTNILNQELNKKTHTVLKWTNLFTKVLLLNCIKINRFNRVQSGKGRRAGSSEHFLWPAFIYYVFCEYCNICTSCTSATSETREKKYFINRSATKEALWYRICVCLKLCRRFHNIDLYRALHH